MNMLACDDRSHGVTLLCAALDALILKLGPLLLETSFNGLRITVVMFTSLYRENVVLVTLWEYFAVLYWLDRGVEMILVNFPIDGGLGLFMTVFHNGLLGNSGSNSLMDGGVMVSSLGPIHEDCQPRLVKKAFHVVRIEGRTSIPGLQRNRPKK